MTNTDHRMERTLKRPTLEWTIQRTTNPRTDKEPRCSTAYLAGLPNVDVGVEGGDDGVVHGELYVVEAWHLRHEGNQAVLVDLFKNF
jgi:hypothetical protein